MHHTTTPLTPHYTHTFNLPRPDGSTLPLTLRPLPLGFHQRLRQHGISPPTPPTRVARDSRNQPLRDEHGRALTINDEHNPRYREELELYHQRVAVLVAVEALSEDPHLTFDTPRPTDTQPWSIWADQLYEEFAQAGFSDGDLIQLCNQAARLSNLLDNHINETYRNFSPSPREPAP